MGRKRLTVFTDKQKDKIYNVLCAIIKKVGSQKKVGEMLGVTQTQVSYYLYGKMRLSAENTMLLSKEFNVPKHLLRPDLFKKNKKK